MNGDSALRAHNGRNGKLDVSALENWLWEAACVIRGPVDAPKFKDYILPLVPEWQDHGCGNPADATRTGQPPRD